jgi:hypothetical protein
VGGVVLKVGSPVELKMTARAADDESVSATAEAIN